MRLSKVFVLAAALGLQAATSAAQESQVVGVIQGYTCVARGFDCPADKEDAVVALEKIFVVLEGSGKYYFLPNVDRAVLARHFLDRVRVTGHLDEAGRSVRVRMIEKKGDQGWAAVWSVELEWEMRRRFGSEQ